MPVVTTDALTWAGPAYMVAMNLLDWNEKRLATNYLAQYKPTALPDKPTLTGGDVSIIVPTIDTEDTFTECLRQWIVNKPKEIIIVTIPSNYLRIKKLIQPILSANNKEDVEFRILTVPQPNKRKQLVRGIQAASGKVLALVDDDVFWPTTTVLPYLLAPLEEDKYGASAGSQQAHLPADRMNESTITPWEVAGLRKFDGASKYYPLRSAADGGMWCVAGHTIFVKASLLQNEEFHHAFLNESWCGNKLNTGDDVFLTRWIQVHKKQGFAIQDVPEAQVTTTIKRDSGFAWQMVRWQRSAVVMMLTYLLYDPGFFALRKEYPYMARKMVERLLRPVLNYIYVAVWCLTFNRLPMVALAILMFHVHMKLDGIATWLERRPYCRQHFWTIVRFDHCSYFLDLYCWLTLASDEWMTRNDHPDTTTSPGLNLGLDNESATSDMSETSNDHSDSSTSARLDLGFNDESSTSSDHSTSPWGSTDPDWVPRGTDGTGGSAWIRIPGVSGVHTKADEED